MRTVFMLMCTYVCVLVFEADKESCFENCQDSLMHIRWQGNAQ